MGRLYPSTKTSKVKIKLGIKTVIYPRLRNKKNTPSFPFAIVLQGV